MKDSILNVEVSWIPDYFQKDKIGNVNLLDWLLMDTYKDKIDWIRQMTNKSLRDKEKAKLPAIMPAGTFSRADSAHLIKASGFMQFDIDYKDNQHISNFMNLKDEISKLENIAYCGLSASGKGFWGLIPIKHPDKIKEHFIIVKETFSKYGIVLDNKPKNIVSLRGYSYDENAFFNHHAKQLEKYYEKSQTYIKGTKTSINKEHPINEQYVLECIEKIEAAEIDITAIKHGYDDWFSIGCNFACTFGEKGREYFHRVSVFHPQYSHEKTQQQYNRCLNYVDDKQSLDTFFNRCASVQITYTETKE